MDEVNDNFGIFLSLYLRVANFQSWGYACLGSSSAWVLANYFSN